jgi:hypothetical protein
LSFFDDDEDEPPRGAPRARPTSGRGPAPARDGGGYDSGYEQAIQQRRTIAIVAVVIVVVLMALLIKSCESSATTNALKSYNASVSQLISQSDATGSQVFSYLRGATNNQNVAVDLAAEAGHARTELSTAEGLSAPGAMSSAQANIVLTMQMRYDAIESIANNIPQAIGGEVAAAKSAVTQLAIATTRLYASDVVYKGYAVNEIAKALNGDGIPTTGLDAVTINGGQVVSDLSWLQSTYIATEIGAKVAGGVGTGVNTLTGEPGVHGHVLNFVDVDGSELSTVGTNTISASPAPTFTLNLTNGGQYTEYNVKCTVSVIGQEDDTGTTTLPETLSGQTSTCTVTLPRAPATGQYQVEAEVGSVPGEKNTANNILNFGVDFN